MAETLRGQNVVIKSGQKVIGGQKNATIDISGATIDVTTKESEGWTEAVGGDLSWSATCDGLYLVSDAGYQELLTKMIAKEPIDLVATDAAKKIYRSGKAIITALSEDLGKDDVVSYSASFTGTGALTVTAPVSLSEKAVK